VNLPITLGTAVATVSTSTPSDNRDATVPVEIMSDIICASRVTDGRSGTEATMLIEVCGDVSTNATVSETASSTDTQEAAEMVRDVAQGKTPTTDTTTDIASRGINERTDTTGEPEHRAD